MSRAIGIDIRAGHIRAALISTQRRKVLVERLIEVERNPNETLEESLKACRASLGQKFESLVVGLPGEQVFIYRLTLPGSAKKQLNEVLPFELESHLPMEIDEMVFDHRLIGAAAGVGSGTALTVLAAAARTEVVKQRIDLFKASFGVEPDRVGSGPLPFANLATLSPQLAGTAPVAVVDLGATSTELVVLVRGEPAFARTLSRGMRDVPHRAEVMVAELRQTLAAWVAQGSEPVERMILVGGGALDLQAAPYLAYHLGIPADVLSGLDLLGVSPEEALSLPRFAKALALALGAGGKAKDLDLRRGDLVRRHGYDFLKERVPLLSGLTAAILVSGLFSTWAELRTLSREEEVLTGALSAVSKEVLGESFTDPDAVVDQLAGKIDALPLDPMPHADAFDLLMELSDSVPKTLTHDIEELDLSSRGHVKINGIVPTKNDAQQVEGIIKKMRCVRDPKLGKLTQAIGSDKQKYSIEFDLRCPEDEAKKKKAKPAEAPKEPSKESGKEVLP